MIKRIFDLLLSFLGLIIILPFFLVISLLIKLDSKGPIFFRQVRVGQYGHFFYIFKFRTMYLNSEEIGKITIGNDKRVTKVGFFLRKYKLDELPQLLNVLLGEMSLVGPRPEVPEFVSYYSEDDIALVFSVKPGITDFASIEMVDENIILSKYDNPHLAYIEVILPTKIAFYKKYCDSHSLILDIKIIFLTILKIMRR